MNRYARAACLSLVLACRPSVVAATDGLSQDAARQVPDSAKTWGVLWSLIVWSGGTALLTQVARDRGKAREPELFELWGGKPTTRLLRHRETTNPVLLARRHKKLAELLPDLRIPSAGEEAADHIGADHVYDACVRFLLEKTRAKDLGTAGYAVHFFFLWLPSADFAVERVADRVRAGGHNVPVETVRRRYRVGLRNFFRLYEPLASTWRLYDSSGPEPRLVAERLESQPLRVYDESVWAVVKRQGTS